MVVDGPDTTSGGILFATTSIFVNERAFRSFLRGGDRVKSFMPIGIFGGVLLPFLNIDGGRNACILMRERRLGDLLVDWLGHL